MKSNESSSCELSLDSDNVILYLREGAQCINYYDVARALAEFVFTTPTVDINLISNKLSLSKEALKQRGIPVDLLMDANVSEAGKINCFTDLLNRIKFHADRQVYKAIFSLFYDFSNFKKNL